jgi:hypothetical protein
LALVLLASGACATSSGGDRRAKAGLELFPRDTAAVSWVRDPQALLATLGWDHLASRHPDVYRDITEGLTQELGFDALNPAELLARGLDPARPVAVGLVDAKDEIGAVVAHLADPWKLVALADGWARAPDSGETIGSATVHRFGGPACLTVRGDQAFVAWSERAESQPEVDFLCVTAASRLREASLAAHAGLEAVRAELRLASDLWLWLDPGLVRDALQGELKGGSDGGGRLQRLLYRTIQATAGVAVGARVTPEGADIVASAPLGMENPFLELFTNAPAARTAVALRPERLWAISAAFRPTDGIGWLAEILEHAPGRILQAAAGPGAAHWGGTSVAEVACFFLGEDSFPACPTELGLSVGSDAGAALGAQTAGSEGLASLFPGWWVVGEMAAPRQPPAPEAGLDAGGERALLVAFRPAAALVMFGIALSKGLGGFDGEGEGEAPEHENAEEFDRLLKERNRAETEHRRASTQALLDAARPVCLMTLSVRLAERALQGWGQLRFGSGTWTGALDAVIALGRDQDTREEAWRARKLELDRQIDALR